MWRQVALLPLVPDTCFFPLGPGSLSLAFCCTGNPSAESGWYGPGFRDHSNGRELKIHSVYHSGEGLWEDNRDHAWHPLFRAESARFMREQGKGDSLEQRQDCTLPGPSVPMTEVCPTQSLLNLVLSPLYLFSDNVVLTKKMYNWHSVVLDFYG